MKQVPRAVFDCMVYLQAAVSRFGPAAQLFRYLENDAARLLVSREILDEVRDVLSRPKIRAKNPHLTDDYVAAFLIRVENKATLVKRITKYFEYARDSKDEKYINLAVTAGASYIVSRDKDLLDLMTGYIDECKDFRRRFRPLKVVDPVAFLQILEASESV